MIKELFGKIKNKPDDAAVGSLTPVADSSSPQAASSSVQSKEDLVMEQIKMLIDINKTLNDKTKALEGRVDNLEQVMGKYAQLVERLMTNQTGSAPQAAAAVAAPSAPVTQAQQPAPQQAATAAQPMQPAAPAQAPPQAATAAMRAPLPQAMPRAVPAPQAQRAPMPQPARAQPAPATNPMTNPAILAAQQSPQAAVSSPLYRNAHEKDYFVLHDGKVLKNSVELLSALKNMNDQTFFYYVNGQKNDFSTWIRYCLSNEILANEVNRATTRADAIRVIESFM